MFSPPPFHQSTPNCHQSFAALKLKSSSPAPLLCQGQCLTQFRKENKFTDEIFYTDLLIWSCFFFLFLIIT